MIIGILVVTLAGIALGVTQLPEGQVFSFSLPLPTETFLQMDLKGALHHGLISIIFTLTMVDLFDNMGVLIGLAQKAGFVREDGHIENLDRALITDSVATMTSAVMGATTATSYLESAAGRGRRRPHRAHGRDHCRAVLSGFVLYASGGSGARLRHGAGADHRGRAHDARRWGASALTTLPWPCPLFSPS